METLSSHHCIDTGNTGTQTALIDKNQPAIRLAPGESWDKKSIKLAMLLTALKSENQGNSGDMLIRSNRFSPEFEPSRHEMRVFDDLDGLVTEM